VLGLHGAPVAALRVHPGDRCLRWVVAGPEQEDDLAAENAAGVLEGIRRVDRFVPFVLNAGVITVIVLLIVNILWKMLTFQLLTNLCKNDINAMFVVVYDLWYSPPGGRQRLYSWLA
jgi:hypothetical protein